MTETNPNEDFFTTFQRDVVDCTVASAESYHAQFPSVSLDDIQAMLNETLTGSGAPDPTAWLNARTVSQIGPYEIIKELGRGGQGIVFLAEDSRLGRKVALKVLTSWSQASRNVVARFKREAAIASKLEHPGVCTVYETGEANGAPYLAMQFVEGESLASRISSASTAAQTDRTSFLDLEASSDEDIDRDPGATPSFPTSVGVRSAPHDSVVSVVCLMEKIARALHAAHEAGVIHRDIKPGNIMVTAEGEPVILDFGLARDLDGDHETLTQTDELFGTPAYMAPEQISGAGIVLDRRADVWALGVTLFECLGLQRPFQGAARESLYRSILNQEPKGLRALNSRVSKDLAVVVGTALEKDRNRRYQSALDFADDLRRFLDHKPIQAKPVGPFVRLVRWSERNRVVAASIVAILLSLSAGLAITMREKSRADDALATKGRALDQKDAERRRTQTTLVKLRVEEVATQSALAEVKTERAKAAAALRRAETVKAFLNDDVLGQISLDGVRKGRLVRDLLDEASARIDGKLNDSPLIEADIRMTLGEVYRQLGKNSVSQMHFERALELRRDELGEEHQATVSAMGHLGLVHANRGSFDRAMELHEETLAHYRRLFGEGHSSTLSSLSNLGKLHDSLGNYDRAQSLHKRVLETSLRVLGADHRDTVSFMNFLGWHYNSMGKFDLALPLLEKALAVSSSTLGEDHPDTLVSVGILGAIYYSKGQYDRALPLFESTLAIRRRVLGDEHQSTLSSMSNLGQLFVALHKYELALPLSLESLKIARTALGEDHPYTLTFRHNLATLYESQGKYDLALPLFVRGLADSRRVHGESHPDTLGAMNGLGLLYKRQHKYSLALPLLEEGLDVTHRLLTENHPSTLIAMNNLAILYRKVEKPDRARKLHERVAVLSPKVLGSGHPTTIAFMGILGSFLMEESEHDRALQQFEKTLEVSERSLGKIHAATRKAKFNVATCLIAKGSYAKAEPLMLAVYEGAVEVNGAKHRSVLSAIEWMAQLYSQWGKGSEAAKWRRKLQNK